MILDQVAPTDWIYDVFFGTEPNLLSLYNEENDNLFYSSRNNQNVAVLSTEEVNVLDLVATKYLLIEEASVKKLEEVLN